LLAPEFDDELPDIPGKDQWILLFVLTRLKEHGALPQYQRVPSILSRLDSERHTPQWLAVKVPVSRIPFWQAGNKTQSGKV
jgi:hypothetical protein